MIWTALLNNDGSIKNVKPGNYFYGKPGLRFTVHATDFKSAWKLAQDKAAAIAVREVCKPKVERHPAFRPRRTGDPLCRCNAILQVGEKMCAVCRRQEEKAIECKKALDLLPPREMKSDEAHLRIILEVRERWMKCPNVGSFGQWLNAEVLRLEQASCPVPLMLEPAPV